MKLRELIDKLEKLSDKGNNDKLEVIYSDIDGYCDVEDVIINESWEIEII